MSWDSGIQEIKRKYNNLINTISPNFLQAIIMTKSTHSTPIFGNSRLPTSGKKIIWILTKDSIRAA
jgi:hypothetical protein